MTMILNTLSLKVKMAVQAVTFLVVELGVYKKKIFRKRIIQGSNNFKTIYIIKNFLNEINIAL